MLLSNRSSSSESAMYWLNLTCHPFPVTCELRTGFTFLNSWGKEEVKVKMFHDVWQICEIQISVSMSEVLLEQSHAPLFVSSTGWFQATTAELSNCDKNLIVSQSLKYLLSDFLQKKVSDSWSSSKIIQTSNNHLYTSIVSYFNFWNRESPTFRYTCN